VRVSSTRSSFTWIAGSTSPISSRKTVPSGGQTSSQPEWSDTAPVNAPRRWPNSSDSIRVGDSADRFSGKNDSAQLSRNVPASGSNGM
jgi:hypothetical protein